MGIRAEKNKFLYGKQCEKDYMTFCIFKTLLLTDDRGKRGRSYIVNETSHSFLFLPVVLVLWYNERICTTYYIQKNYSQLLCLLDDKISVGYHTKSVYNYMYYLFIVTYFTHWKLFLSNINYVKQFLELHWNQFWLWKKHER